MDKNETELTAPLDFDCGTVIMNCHHQIFIGSNNSYYQSSIVACNGNHINIIFVAKRNVFILVTCIPWLNAIILISVARDTITRGSMAHKKESLCPFSKKAGKRFTNVDLKTFVKDLFSVSI